MPVDLRQKKKNQVVLKSCYFQSDNFCSKAEAGWRVTNNYGNRLSFEDNTLFFQNKTTTNELKQNFELCAHSA